MKRHACLTSLLFVLLAVSSATASSAPVSEATQECLDCHSVIHGGIVQGWQASRHAVTTPGAAAMADELTRRVSSAQVAEPLQEVAVGCAECHTLRPEAHADSFEHNGYTVHVVVSPQDCATCHATEAKQYGQNIMAHAYQNLMGNPLYAQLRSAIIGQPEVTADGELKYQPAPAAVEADSCLYCHGTRLSLAGTQVRETDLGEMAFPMIDGWPNQGVGRINLDGSRGSCSACHARHEFSMAMARKPDTCKQCHVGPDVPAYKIYSASSHGNIYSSLSSGWNFKAVPWTVGKHFTAPTCAACHLSLLTNGDGEVVVQRTHQMSDRLPWRIYGLIYAHPHPLDPDTTKIRTKDGLPLPTDLDGGLAQKYLIGADEQAKRAGRMQAVCLQCHSTSWTRGHWQKFEEVIHSTNASLLTGTRIMGEIWRQNLARGLAQQANPFDESVERLWTDSWLFYANSIRFASAMAGGGDYGVFAGGRYQLASRIQALHQFLETTPTE